MHCHASLCVHENPLCFSLIGKTFLSFKTHFYCHFFFIHSSDFCRPCYFINLSLYCIAICFLSYFSGFHIISPLPYFTNSKASLGISCTKILSLKEKLMVDVINMWCFILLRSMLPEIGLLDSSKIFLSWDTGACIWRKI